MSTAFDFHSKPLGIIGLGLLGSALAGRAIDQGLAVVGYDIAEAARFQLATSGGEVVETAEGVAARCRVILLVLPHDGVTRDVLQTLLPHLQPDTILLDATTGDAAQTAQLGTRLAQRGIHYLDTTISGSSVEARRGEILMMVGGEKATFEMCLPLFHHFASRVIHTGPSGSGAQIKLVTNLVLGLNRACLAEGLVFAEALGLDLSHTLDVLKASAAYSRVMDTKGTKMITQDFQPQARLSQHHKDVNLILEAANREGISLPFSRLHDQLLQFAESAGWGDKDNSAVIEAIRTASKPQG